MNKWLIQSKSRDLKHEVKYENGEYICDCEYYNFKGWRRGTCSHIKEVQKILKDNRGEKVENKLGALWLKESGKGKKYMSGNIEINGEKIQIVVFKNDKGGVETRPDYQIFKSEKREQVVNANNESEEISVDEIPF